MWDVPELAEGLTSVLIACRSFRSDTRVIAIDNGVVVREGDWAVAGFLVKSSSVAVIMLRDRGRYAPLQSVWVLDKPSRLMWGGTWAMTKPDEGVVWMVGPPEATVARAEGRSITLHRGGDASFSMGLMLGSLTELPSLPL